MNIIDYRFSYIAGKSPENQVRFVVESRTRIIDEKTGRTEDYYQCASCKSEDTFAQRDLFYEDNYDFLPIFGPEWAIVFRRRAYLDDRYKSTLRAEELWNGNVFHIVEPTSVRLLESTEQIRHATRDWLPVVGQTEIWSDQNNLRAIIEYPVKTMNIHHGRNLYQVDTGPVAFPDLTKRSPRAVDGISLAFVACNAPHFADFVIEEQTPIPNAGGQDCLIHHYSKRLSLPAQNRFYAIES